MRRDYVFFVKGIDPQLYVHDRHFFVVTLGDPIKRELLKLRQHSDGVARWFEISKPITVAVVRNDLATKDDGFKSAFKTISGLCDIYAVLLEEPPEISPLPHNS